MAEENKGIKYKNIYNKFCNEKKIKINISCFN